MILLFCGVGFRVATPNWFFKIDIKQNFYTVLKIFLFWFQWYQKLSCRIIGSRVMNFSFINFQAFFNNRPKLNKQPYLHSCKSLNTLQNPIISFGLLLHTLYITHDFFLSCARHLNLKTRSPNYRKLSFLHIIFNVFTITQFQAIFSHM